MLDVHFAKEDPMILFINACMRGEASRTLSLCRDYLHGLEQGGASVVEVSLDQLQLEPFDGEKVALRNRFAKEGTFDDDIFDCARQLVRADEVVIGAPYWDLSFPAALKTYIEYASVCDITFHYTEEGRAEGLCRSRRATYITTAGGFVTYEDGEHAPLEPAPGKNLGYDYVCAIAEMFGLGPVRYIAAEGLDVVTVNVDVQMFRARECIARLVAQDDAQYVPEEEESPE